MASAYEIYKEGGLLNARYQKLEEISEGAYGLVSLAKDIQRSKLVAVKYIFKLDDDKPPKFKNQQHRFSKSIKQMNDDICEEALHEIEIHEKLGHHLNIVSFLDCFDSFIILEYCPRGDLYEAIKDGIGPTSTRDIINVVVQLISAVEFAHSKSIYHRDIKPENILISDDWTIRLSDWGLASTSRYCNDFGVGSERYMAPELFDEENIHVYDASKIDIWSVGVCLLNLVFRKSPFNVANSTDKSFSYFACNREALFDIFSSMSMDLFAVLRYCLTLDPDNRDLSLMKGELLKVQSLTIDDDLELLESEPAESPQLLEAKPITIENKLSPTKSFAIPTPNSHINKHFQDFRTEDFNRKDFFTPPSVSAHYMENFEKSRKGIYQPPHQRPSTPKNSSLSKNIFKSSNNAGNVLSHWIPAYSSNKRKIRKRGGSFNSFSANAGKYVPPNLRSPAYKSPLHTSVNHNEAVEFEDDEDDLFVLEEADSSNATLQVPSENDTNADLRTSTPNISDTDELDGLQTDLSRMNLEENYLSDVSSAPSLVVSAGIIGNENKSTSSTLHDRIPKLRTTELSSSSSSESEGTETRKAYVPPHHRSNFQTVLKKPWNYYHSNGNNNLVQSQNNYYNHRHYKHHDRRHSTSSSLKRELVSSSVPSHKTYWFSPTKLDLDDDEEEDDFEKSELYRNFASRVGEFGDNAAQKLRNNHANEGYKTGFKGKDHYIRESTREINPSTPIGLQ